MKTTNQIIAGLLLIISSCSSIKLTNQYNVNSKIEKPIERIFLFSAKDSIPNDALLIGEFTLIEDSKNKWHQIKSKLNEFAKTNNANGIIVNRIGWSLKGHGFYLQGKLFYYPDDKLKKVSEENNPDTYCKLTLYRDEGEPALGAGFKMDIKIDNFHIENFPNRQTITFNFEKCGKVDLNINKKEYQITFNPSEHIYLKLSKQVSGSNIGGVIGISIGGITILEIQDRELGKLLSEQYDSYAQQ